MIEQELQKLIQAAIEMRKQSYSPYSNFAVGAAVLSNDGYIYGGCNIENASYGLTNCAERTAIFNAVSDGKRNISAIAVVADTDRPCSPCGACRQVIGEFKIPCIIMANLKGEYKTVTLEELLPFSFSNTDL
ncbi:cytidine deaminase [Veillonella tobetsuensis]|jgi:cytidine deaminase|uniref:Cytidine deaminase n=1 Tax=Veillonella tobetsuensis TaxID=1110546 RepID=A0A2S7ZS67_9FIRM|nr:cytidine deaminase [Veillonella tobetsuensis]MBF1756451.1 cytidine deaminase [Veillonella tobetsuensis]PQL26103.1 cytidine deaminase [Veillonella tobetsuensis]